ncbi:hypothetical protein [Nocardioides sp. SYSU DS0651]|uniref:hypothetical protein n=1 Tax=Nocardioides sp. SYSU DS0651 TaxID=3415955 RepID=UPI003F4B65CA
MPTIDLTTPADADRPADLRPVQAAPRRIGLTLRELEHAARLAGGAPLPFQVAAPAAAGAMESRLGQSPATTEDQAYRAVVASLHDPAESLARRGLVAGDELDPGVAGAIGLLAAPRIALDLDVRTGGVQAKVWHRQDGPAVASLATVDGIVFELGWFPTDAWAGELARVAVVSEEVPLTASAVPSYLDLPYELADAAAEATRTGRADLLPVLAGRHTGKVLGPDGPLPDVEVGRVLAALSSEAQGRLRAMVADVATTEVESVGVLSWTLLADGWHALRPHHQDGMLRIELRSVEPSDLATVVAPVLAPVVAPGRDGRVA